MIGWILVVIAIIGLLFAIHKFMIAIVTKNIKKDVDERIGVIDYFDIRERLGK